VFALTTSQAHITETTDESLVLLSTSPVTVVSPLDVATGNITGLVKGQSYLAGDGMVWVDTNDAWPDLTGANTIITMDVDTGVDPTTWAMADTTSDGHTAVKLELTTAQTSALAFRESRVYDFRIWATFWAGSPLAVTSRLQLVCGTISASE
jgi:hypothetical protein